MGSQAPSSMHGSFVSSCSPLTATSRGALRAARRALCACIVCGTWICHPLGAASKDSSTTAATNELKNLHTLLREVGEGSHTALDREAHASALCTMLVALARDLDVDAVIAPVAGPDLDRAILALGSNGRATLIGCLSDRLKVAVLDAVSAKLLIDAGEQTVQGASTYEAVVIKQERVDGELLGPEHIRLRYQASPRAFTMSWLKGRHAGRRLLYSTEELGEDQVRVRESGVLGLVPVTIDIHSGLARRGTNHVVTEIGFSFLLNLMRTEHNKTAPHGLLKRINHGFVSQGGRAVYKAEYLMMPPKGTTLYCRRFITYIDPALWLPVRVEVYKQPGTLYESFEYTKVDLKARIAGDYFSSDNPALNL